MSRSRCPYPPRATRRGRRRMDEWSSARRAEISGLGAQRALRVGACPQAGRARAGPPGPVARARRLGRRPGAHAPPHSRARPRTALREEWRSSLPVLGGRWNKSEEALEADLCQNCKKQVGRGSRCAFRPVGAERGVRAGSARSHLSATC